MNDTENKTVYFLIKDGIAQKINEETYNKNEYFQDYVILSPDNSIKIIDLDKRKIRFYAMWLLNSMGEIPFYKIQKWTLWAGCGLVVGMIVIFVRTAHDQNTDKILNEISNMKTKVCTLSGTIK